MKALLKEKNVLLLKADKTNPDVAIEKELSRLNRTAIPVNALFVDGFDQPQITPEALNPIILEGFLSEHLDKE